MKENGESNEKYVCIFHMMLNCKIKIRVIMFQFVIFLLLSVVLAKNYAIIYASIEPIRDSTLPTSACHIISVLISALYTVIVFKYGWVRYGEYCVYARYNRLHDGLEWMLQELVWK